MNSLGTSHNRRIRRTDIAASIIADLLQKIPQQFPARVWRRNVGTAYDGGRLIRFGLPGEADIDGVITVAGVGIRLAIEVKAPGDKQSGWQRNYQNMIEAHGGIYILAQDAEQAVRDLRGAVRVIESRIAP
jgi:hypothetical protein